jgi:hypothetical protein
MAERPRCPHQPSLQRFHHSRQHFSAFKAEFLKFAAEQRACALSVTVPVAPLNPVKRGSAESEAARLGRLRREIDNGLKAEGRRAKLGVEIGDRDVICIHCSGQRRHGKKERG